MYKNCFKAEGLEEGWFCLGTCHTRVPKNKKVEAVEIVGKRVVAFFADVVSSPLK